MSFVTQFYTNLLFYIIVRPQCRSVTQFYLYPLCYNLKILAKPKSGALVSLFHCNKNCDKTLQHRLSKSFFKGLSDQSRVVGVEGGGKGEMTGSGTEGLFTTCKAINTHVSQ